MRCSLTFLVCAIACSYVMPANGDQYEGHESIPSQNWLELILSEKKVGIVNENRVNVRSDSNLQAKKVGQLNRGTIVQIYAEKGTGKVTAGIWDYWYKIEESNSHWINAFFVDKLPIQFTAKQPPHLFKNPRDVGTLLKIIDDTKDIIIVKAPTITDRSRDKYVFDGKEDYWYYISDRGSILDDTWIHGSEIEPFLGAPFRLLDTTDNALLSLPRVLDRSLSTLLERPRSIENIGQEDERLPPTIRYNYGTFSIDLHEQSENMQFLFRVTITSAVDGPLLKYGINVGVEKNYLVKTLGMPEEVQDQYWIYSYPLPLNNTLYLTMKNNKIAEVVWVAAVP